MQQYTVYFNPLQSLIMIQLLDHTVTYLLLVMSLKVLQICRLEFTKLLCMSLCFRLQHSQAYEWKSVEQKL